jgi:transposase
VDESGFSLSPILGKTWAPVNQPPLLRECFSRNSQTGLGMLALSPRQQLRFFFTVFSGSAATDDFVFWLTQLHHFYRGQKAIILWDGLTAHRSTESHFQAKHPDWFLFEHFPAYSPELNPVEPCWNWMKNVDMANFVPKDVADLHSRTLESAKRLSHDHDLLLSHIKYTKLKL